MDKGKDWEVVFTPLGPLQGVIYEQTGNRVKKPEFLALAWLIPGILAGTNAAPVGAMIFFAAAGWEALFGARDESAFDEADKLIAAAEARLSAGGEKPAELPSADKTVEVPPDEEELFKAFMQQRYGPDWQSQQSEPDPDPQPYVYQPGINTQLNALPTNSAPVKPQPNSVSQGIHNTISQALSQGHAGRDSDEVLAKIKAYAAILQNLLVVAVGGAGKGIVLSNLCRYRYESDPRAIDFWFDPKGLEEESGYHDHPNIYSYRFNAVECEGHEIINHTRTAINKFKAICAVIPDKNPIRFIFDEWYFVQGELKRKNPAALGDVETMLRAAVSMMDAQHRHIILVVQSPKMDDILKGGGGLLSNFGTIGIFRRQDRSYKMLDKCNQCGTIPRHVIRADGLYAVCDLSVRKRAIYLNGEMLPMPELPNYSGYDRDMMSYINESHQLVNYRNLADEADEDINPIQAPPKPTLYGDEDLPGLEVLGLDDGLPDLADLFDDFIPPDTTNIDKHIAQMEKHPKEQYRCLGGLLKAIRAKGMKASSLTIKDVDNFNWAKVWNSGEGGRAPLIKNRDADGYKYWLKAVIRMGYIQPSSNNDEYKLTLS